MHVGWAALFSPPSGAPRPSFEALSAHIEGRLGRAPRPTHGRSVESADSSRSGSGSTFGGGARLSRAPQSRLRT